MRGQVLVIEDDEDILDLLSHQLADLGYSVESAGDGESGLQLALSNPYVLVVLDLMLPRLGGLEVCRRLRKEKAALPILMLTARSEDIDKVLGLETGADEYMTKPFNVLEFKARVRALLRRIEAIGTPDPGGAPLRLGSLMINDAAREVRIDGKVIDLTPIEYDLLLLLASTPGRVFSREDLLQHVWGCEGDGYDHNVNTHVSRLRSKLETGPAPKEFIRTVRGVGYRFVRDDEA